MSSIGTYADGAVIITIDADGKLAIQELKKTKEQVDEVGESSEDSKEKVGGLGEETKNSALEMAAFSATLAVGAKELLDIGAAAVTASSQFESAFAKTQTIMDTNVLSVSDMREEVLSLSKDSAMAATDVSEAAYQAISGSVATQDAAAFVEQANKLAVAGFTGLSNATDVLTTTLNSYKLGAEQVGGISNVLIQTQNLGKTSVDELASSMGRAISTGSAYGVNLQNISTSYVELTRSGIATAEATTYLSGMLNELGDAGSTVGGILQEKTGQSFGQLMAQGWSLGDVLQVLSDSVDGNAEALMGLWSSQEAGKAANAIMTQGIEDFNAVIAQMNQEMSGATGTTEKAYATMTDTSEFIDKKFHNSVNNLTIAFGDGLTPVLNDTKQWLTGIVDGLAEFVQQNPWVSAAFAGLTVGIGAMAIGLAAYTLKTKLATSATLKLTAAMATNPIMLAVGAVAALTAVLATYTAQQEDATKKTEELSGASQHQAEHIAKLQQEYNALCEAGKETSAEAQILGKELEAARAEFEKSKTTYQEMSDAIKVCNDSYEERKQVEREAAENLELEYQSNMNLINQLIELTSAEEQTVASKEKILAIVDILNERIPELGLNYDRLTGKLNMTPEEVISMAESANASEQNAANYNQLKTNIAQRDELRQNYDDAQTQVEVKQEKIAGLEEKKRQALAYNASLSPQDFRNGKGKNISSIDKAIETATKELSAAEAEAERAKTAFEENEAEIQSLAEGLADYSEETATATGDMAGMTETMKARLDELATAYTEAYNAAYDSISGQFALWEKAPQVAAVSVAELTAAMQSQTAYWTGYNDSLSTILSYTGQIEGLGDVVADLGSGSEEAVAYSAAIAQALRDGDIESVRTLVAEYGNLKTAQKEAAEGYADVETGYSDKVLKMAEEIAAGIEELDIDEAAYNLGELAIDQFIAGADGQLPAVQEAYGLIGTAAAEALYSALNLPTPTKPNASRGYSAYASGTSYAAAGYAIVGENGPELVYFQGGERVLTAEETQAALRTVYPTAPQMTHLGTGSPAIARSGGIQICATFAVPLEIDGREFARATAEYNGEEMEFEVM